MDFSIVGLQVQRGPVKIGRAPLRRYEPSAMVAVTSIQAGPRGVRGITDDGELVIDVHHQDHPQSRDRRGRAGILLMGTGDYVALRERYGDHVTDGIAGETILLEAPDGLAGLDLPYTATVKTAGGALPLNAVRAADPCVEFSRFCLLQPVSPLVDEAVQQALIDLDGGARGYRSIATSEGTISIGDSVTFA